MTPTLSKKNILITGGTSRLGRAFVEKALSRGANVFFTYFENKSAAEELVKKGAEAHRLDLASSKEIDDLGALFKSEKSHLDVLIHNAAAVRDHTIKNLTEEDWDYVLNVDLKAPYYLTKKMLPMMMGRKQRAASACDEKKVFFLTSRVALQGGFGVSNYAAAKAGLIALTQSVARELGKRKVLVNAINPGFMKSGMTEGLPQEVIDRNLQASPLEDYSNPDEVADFLIYLCSDQVTQVTGQVINFEGRKI